MPISNKRIARSIDPEEIRNFIANARSSFNSYKESAARAVANAFMAHQELKSKFATSEGQRWLTDEIAKRNTAIEEANKKLDELRTRAKKFKDNKLEEAGDWIYQKPKNAEERKAIEAEVANLTKLAKLGTGDWTAQRQLKIEMREGASLYTEIVKFVFEFDRSHHATVISRFCAVMEWIEAKAKGQRFEDADEIVGLIETEGGFEFVIEEMRLKRNGEDEDTKDRTIIAEENLKEVKEVLKSAPSMGSLVFEPKFAKEKFVMLVGRYEGGSVEIVTELPVGDGELDRLIARYENPTALPVPETTEFIARMLELGSLVPEGSDGNEVTASKNATDEPSRGQRAIVLRLSDDEKREFVISSQGADASPVIYVYPKEQIDLGTPASPVFLTGKNRKALEKKVFSYDKRRKIDFTFDMTPKQGDGQTPATSPMSWLACHATLKAKDRKNAVQQYFWFDLAKTGKRPLEVDNFRPSFKATLSSSDIELIFNLQMKPWFEAKDPKKDERQFAIAYKDQVFLVAFKDGDGYKTDVPNSQGEHVQLNFRPRDFYELFSLLVRQHGKDYEISGDVGGLLEVRWSDNLADYRVCLPTRTTDNRLQGRRLEPMRIIRAASKVAA